MCNVSLPTSEFNTLIQYKSLFWAANSSTCLIMTWPYLLGFEPQRSEHLTFKYFPNRPHHTPYHLVCLGAARACLNMGFTKVVAFFSTNVFRNSPKNGRIFQISWLSQLSSCKGVSSWKFWNCPAKILKNNCFGMAFYDWSRGCFSAIYKRLFV